MAFLRPRGGCTGLLAVLVLLQLPSCAKSSPEPSAEPSASSAAEAVLAEPAAKALAEATQASAGGEADIAPTAPGSVPAEHARAIPGQPSAALSGSGEARAPAKEAPTAPRTEPSAAEPAQPTEKVAWTSGPRQADPAFAVWLEGPARVAPGAQSSARVRVHANEPYKVNDKYPAKFTWDSTGAVSVSDTTVRGLGITGKDGTLQLSFTPNQPGPLTLSGTLSFSVCTEANCRVEKRKLQLATQAVP